MKKKRKFKKGKKKLSNKSTVTTQNKTKNSKTISKKSLIKRVFTCILAILSIWGICLTTWVVFVPRVFVYPGVSLDPNNPAFTTFTVQNQGNFNVYDVKVSNSVKYLKLPGDILVVGLGNYTNRFSDPKHVASVIAPWEQYSVPLALTGMEHNKIENADIAIVLTFKPSKWLSWQHETLHRFVSTQGKDKQWHWLPQPIKK